jgi:PAS domain S-box-containing protein
VTAAPLRPDEAERLAALRRCGILDTEPEPAFDDLTLVASIVCETPIAAITLVDEHRQWFKSIVGLPVRETSRDLSFCAHTIVEGDLLVVPDALADARFADNPLVTSEPRIRFYAGVPLITKDGHPIGTLCVVDRVPRTLTPAQITCLRALARQAMNLIEFQGQLSRRTTTLADTLSAREKADLALREKELQLHVVLAQMPAALWTVDRDLTITTSVGGGLTALGLAPGQLVGTRLTDYLGTTDPAFEPLAAHLRALEGTSVSYGYEWQGRPYDVHIEPLEGAAGRVIGAIGLALDVTERKRAEAELRASQERYRSVVETALDAVVTIDEGSKILFANPASERIFGWTPAELAGRPLTTLMPERLRSAHEAGFARYLESGRRTMSWQAVEFSGLRKDGREIPLEISFSESWQDAARRFTGIIRDVTERKVALTERKRLEEQLRQSQKMEAVGRLAGGVAHDFNNVLTAILGYGDLLLTRVVDEELRQHVEEIRRAGQRAASLTSQLLAFSRKQMLAPRVLDPNALVTDLQKMLRRVIGEDIVLVTDLAPDLWRVKADPGQLEHVVMNLAVNARDAMPDGGRLTIRTANAVLEGGSGLAGPHVVLTVTDSGSGMDAQTRARLFEPFFTTKEQGKGTGLGLATSYGIVKQSGGEIVVESEPGSGTTIRVYLPSVDEEIESPISGDFPALRVGGSETILVVEDEKPVGVLARKVLQANGYNVIQANGGEEALEAAARISGPLHLLLTDVVMPGLSGRELAQRLRAVRPELKVLYMSGYTDDAMMRHGLRDTQTFFLQKPFGLETLLSRVRETLDRRQRSPSQL